MTPRSRLHSAVFHDPVSEPEFYGDLVYKFKKIMGRTDFSDQFRKIICQNVLAMI